MEHLADFCVIDAAGDAHSLARRLDGVKAAEVRAFMTDIAREALPSVAEARETQRDRPIALEPALASDFASTFEAAAAQAPTPAAPAREEPLAASFEPAAAAPSVGGGSGGLMVENAVTGMADQEVERIARANPKVFRQETREVIE